MRTSTAIRCCAQWSLSVWISCVVSSKSPEIRPFEDRIGSIAWPSQAMGMTLWLGSIDFWLKIVKVGAYVGEQRQFLSKQRLVHCTHFSGFVVSWAVLLQSPPSAAAPIKIWPTDSWSSRGSWLLWLVMQEASNLWLGAGLWDNAAWWWLGHVGLCVWCLDVSCAQVLCACDDSTGFIGSRVILAGKMLLHSWVCSLTLFLE